MKNGVPADEPMRIHAADPVAGALWPDRLDGLAAESAQADFAYFQRRIYSLMEAGRRVIVIPPSWTPDGA